MSGSRWTRRRFLVAGGCAGVAIPAWLSRGAMASPTRPGANDRIRVGLIGTGHRVRDLLLESPPVLDYVSLADCDLRQIAAFRSWAAETLPDRLASDCSSYQDYREMFDREQLDAVVVATTTHARALICIHAMQAGLDVYAEKPVTLTIEEGQYLIRAEAKYGRVFQTGTQQRSIPINNFGSDLVKNGAIGRVHTVLCPNFLGPEWLTHELPSEPVPVGMDWDMWCHQTELVPYSPQLHPGLGLWGRWRDYDGGGLGWGVTGWGAHAFDQVQRALGTDDTDPEEVWPEGEGADCPVTLRYPGGTLLKLALPRGTGPGLGAVFVGDRGKIEINRNRVASNPSELVRDAPEPDDRSEVASVSQRHLQNWVDCMRTRAKPAAHAEIGHRTQVICYLVNICRELQRRLKWDPLQEEFAGDDQANALRTRARRKGYELPNEV
jgi:predicted dehydrogenase